MEAKTTFLLPVYFTTFTDKLNRRPRKCLSWKSPYEVFFGVVLQLT